MNIEALAQRLQVLEDIEAIKRLKARYCAFCDDGYNPDGIAGLFVADGVWDGGDTFGTCEGQAAIRKFFTGAPKQLPFALHYVMNPRIEVHGDTATGHWYLFQACSYAKNNQAVWGAATYTEAYVRVNGEWKFQRLSVAPSFWTPYEQGWEKKPFV